MPKRRSRPVAAFDPTVEAARPQFASASSSSDASPHRRPRGGGESAWGAGAEHAREKKKKPQQQQQQAPGAAPAVGDLRLVKEGRFVYPASIVAVLDQKREQFRVHFIGWHSSRDEEVGGSSSATLVPDTAQSRSKCAAAIAQIDLLKSALPDEVNLCVKRDGRLYDCRIMETAIRPPQPSKDPAVMHYLQWTARQDKPSSQQTSSRRSNSAAPAEWNEWYQRTTLDIVEGAEAVVPPAAAAAVGGKGKAKAADHSRKRKMGSEIENPQKDLTEGTVVWASLPNFPPWPATVSMPVTEGQVQEAQRHKHKHFLLFFGPPQYEFVPEAQIRLLIETPEQLREMSTQGVALEDKDYKAALKSVSEMELTKEIVSDDSDTPEKAAKPARPAKQAKTAAPPKPKAPAPPKPKAAAPPKPRAPALPKQKAAAPAKPSADSASGAAEVGCQCGKTFGSVQARSAHKQFCPKRAKKAAPAAAAPIASADIDRDDIFGASSSSARVEAALARSAAYASRASGYAAAAPVHAPAAPMRANPAAQFRLVQTESSFSRKGGKVWMKTVVAQTAAGREPQLVESTFSTHAAPDVAAKGGPFLLRNVGRLSKVRGTSGAQKSGSNIGPRPPPPATQPPPLQQMQAATDAAEMSLLKDNPAILMEKWLRENLDNPYPHEAYKLLFEKRTGAVLDRGAGDDHEFLGVGESCMRPITIRTEAAMFRARAVSPPVPDGWMVKCRIYQVQVSTIQHATRWSLRFIGSRGLA